MARGMGGATKVARQHAAGKLTVRERIGLLFDPGTFEEIGILADHQSRREDIRDFYAAADGAVVGTGEVHGRPTLVIADDFTVLGGSNGETGGMKAARFGELSRLLHAPLVFLLDAPGPGPTTGSSTAGPHRGPSASSSVSPGWSPWWPPSSARRRPGRGHRALVRLQGLRGERRDAGQRRPAAR